MSASRTEEFQIAILLRQKLKNWHVHFLFSDFISIFGMRYCVFYDDTTPKVIEKMAEKEIIATLEANVRTLMDLHTKAVAQMADLQRKNEEQALKIRSLQQQLRHEQEEAARLRLSDAMSGGGDKRAARVQVNRLLREIDKCIALVSAKI